jgi:Putative addiction module component
VSPIEPLELEEIVLKLDLPTRAALAEKLLHSLDDLSAEENQALWLSEARRRREELASGKVQPLDGEDVLRRLEAELK